MISPKNKQPNKKLRAFFPPVLLAGILTAGWFVTPATLPHLPLCLFQSVLHLDCPGCGLTRSFLEMARGHFSAAWHYNAAGPLVYLLFLSYFVERVGGIFKDGFRISYPLWFSGAYSVSFIVLLFSHWVVKLWSAGLFFIEMF